MLGGLVANFDTSWTTLEVVPLGKYYFNTGNAPAFLPPNTSQYGCLEIRGSESVKIAYLTCVGTGSGIFQNEYYTGLSTYRGWRRLDNFGCNTPDALASLLGVMRGGTDVQEANFNTLPLNTVYNVKNGTNGPLAAGEDVQVQVFTIGAQYFAFQIARNKSDKNTMYIRFNWGDWASVNATGWKKVSLENL